MCNYFNGDRYEGNWVNNWKDGFGVLYYASGKRYEGNWVDNKKDGHGV